MEPNPDQHPSVLDYALPTRRPVGRRWIATGEMAGIVAALGAAGALLALAHDLLNDPRGWQTNDAMVLSLYIGSAAAIVSVTCFGIGRCLTHFALRRRAILGLVADGFVLVLLGVWIANIAR